MHSKKSLDSEPSEALGTQLRDANASLVISSIRAQDLQADAESINHRQEEFISMLGHELRNPLAAMAMATELLKKMSSSESESHADLPLICDVLERQLTHVVRMVDDIVDASRMRNGKITLESQPLLLSDVISSAVETSQPTINKRSQRLIVNVPPHPTVMEGDLVRLTQVFSNLLINASKFTAEHGHISLSATTTNSTVRVSVTDDGVGIEDDLQLLIFDMFTQGPRALDRAHGGLGIGLALVRMIVEMHGGEITVKSRGKDHGSEFLVVLPFKEEAHLPDRESNARRTENRPRQILIIEDNISANEMLNAILTAEGHIVTSAFDGIGGLQLGLENVYDVIISDIGLPEMDGYEVARQLRLKTSHSLPCLLAMTGYNKPGDKSLEDIGFDHYLVKPVNLNQLKDIISSSVSIGNADNPDADIFNRSKS